MPRTCTKEFTIEVTAAPSEVTLFSYYQCESDPEPDLHGGRNLTPQQAGFLGPFPPPTIVAGKIGNAFEVDTGATRPPGWIMENPPASTSADWNFTGQDFSVRLWVYNPDVTIPPTLTNFIGTTNWGIGFYAGTYRFWFVDTLLVTNVVNVASAYVNGWHHIVAWHRTGSQLGIRVNDSVENTSSPITAMRNQPRLFIINGSYQPVSYLIDEVAIWKGVISDAEITYDYNSGAGRTYPDVPGI